MMTPKSSGRSIDPQRAQDWIRGSLAQGSSLATLVSQRLHDFTAARLLVAGGDHASEQDLDDEGRGIRVADSEAVAARFLRDMRDVGAQCLVVEDDLAVRSDPGLDGRVAFVDQCVLRWVGLEDGSAAARLLRSGSSGYPLNAYVCAQSPMDLQLVARADVFPSAQQGLANSVLAILATVYDGESFVAALPDELNDRIR